uniref:Uncharacterized protein n=1 Tax=Rhodnius prolixus TaxID=13249 RepID=T1HWH9_RHOPR
MEKLIALMKEMKQGQDEMNKRLDEVNKGQEKMREEITRRVTREISKIQDEINGEMEKKVNQISEGMKNEADKVQEADNIREEDEGSKDDAGSRDDRSDFRGVRDQVKGRNSLVEVQESAWSKESIGALENCSGQEEQDRGKSTIIVQPGVEWSPEATREEQLLGEDTGSVLKCQEEAVRNEIAPSSRDVPSYCAQRNSLAIEMGILSRDRKSVDRKEEELSGIHEGITGSHLGVKRAWAKRRQRFSLVGYHEDGVDWGSRSTEWVARKGTSRKTNGALRQDKVGLPLKRIAFDMAGPSPDSRREIRNIPVVKDHFSKRAEAHDLAGQDSSPASAVYQILGVRRKRTTPLHPHSDGMVEQLNKTLGGHQRTLGKDQQENRDVHTPPIMMVYRSAIQETETEGRTPASVVSVGSFAYPVNFYWQPRDGSNRTLTAMLGNFAVSGELHVERHAAGKD